MLLRRRMRRMRRRRGRRRRMRRRRRRWGSRQIIIIVWSIFSSVMSSTCQHHPSLSYKYGDKLNVLKNPLKVLLSLSEMENVAKFYALFSKKIISKYARFVGQFWSDQVMLLDSFKLFWHPASRFMMSFICLWLTHYIGRTRRGGLCWDINL